MSLRDTQVVILETSRDTIRVRIGLHEFLRAPSFVRSENNEKRVPLTLRVESRNSSPALACTKPSLNRVAPVLPR